MFSWKYDDLMPWEIPLIIYNIYFLLTFLYFLKKYYKDISEFKKKFFKILTIIYLLAAVLSTTVFMGYIISSNNNLSAMEDFFKTGLARILLQIAPAFGILYIILLLPFPFLKKIKWSIFYTKK